MTTLTLTDAGSAAIANNMLLGVGAVRILAVVLGDGTTPAGTDDTGRTALRNQIDRADAAGSSSNTGNVLGFTASFTPTQTYAATEAGVIADTGAGTAELLLAYFAGANAADAIGSLVTGTAFAYVAALVIEPDGATITMDPAPNLTLNVNISGLTQTEGDARYRRIATYSEIEAYLALAANIGDVYTAIHGELSWMAVGRSIATFGEIGITTVLHGAGDVYEIANPLVTRTSAGYVFFGAGPSAGATMGEITVTPSAVSGEFRNTSTSISHTAVLAADVTAASYWLRLPSA